MEREYIADVSLPVFSSGTYIPDASAVVPHTPASGADPAAPMAAPLAAPPAAPPANSLAPRVSNPVLTIRSLFADAYVRNNKGAAQKNLRCFPSCDPVGGHRTNSFCGANGILVATGKI